MILMKVSNTGFRASNSFWLKVWLQILIFWLFNFFKIYGSETDSSHERQRGYRFNIYKSLYA